MAKLSVSPAGGFGQLDTTSPTMVEWRVGSQQVNFTERFPIQINQANRVVFTVVI